MSNKVFPIRDMSKACAQSINGGMSQTSKMPCQSYSLPTIACITGYRMAQLEGSVCSHCYANGGNYRKYAANIEPAQHARLDSVLQACQDTTGEVAAEWVQSIITLIGKDSYFRWHDSGDLQSVDHLRLIVLVCELTPNCSHWLPTREYGIVKQYIAQYGALPTNLVVRLSAMYPDQAVKIPDSLRLVDGITASNVHSKGKPMGFECKAPVQDGKCMDCRACWSMVIVSYKMH